MLATLALIGTGGLLGWLGSRLAVGRHLADRIKGQLQDEQGSTLTAQRILNLREELVHFEHRYKRLRRG